MTRWRAGVNTTSPKGAQLGRLKQAVTFTDAAGAGHLRAYVHDGDRALYVSMRAPARFLLKANVFEFELLALLLVLAATNKRGRPKAVTGCIGTRGLSSRSSKATRQRPRRPGPSNHSEWKPCQVKTQGPYTYSPLRRRPLAKWKGRQTRMLSLEG